MQGLSGFFQVESVVNPTDQHSAAKGADPVHAVVSPMLRGQGWPEAARRIHRRAGERPTHQNIHGDGEADGKTCNLAEGAALIGSSSKDDEDQEKGHDPFKYHSHAVAEPA